MQVPGQGLFSAQWISGLGMQIRPVGHLGPVMVVHGRVVGAERARRGRRAKKSVDCEVAFMVDLLKALLVELCLGWFNGRINMNDLVFYR